MDGVAGGRAGDVAREGVAATVVLAGCHSHCSASATVAASATTGVRQPGAMTLALVTFQNKSREKVNWLL